MHQLGLQPGNEILEIGIGTGLTAPLYPDDCRVTGIDVFEPMLREAARNIDGRHNIQLFRMDAARLTFPDESFDVVYAAYVISVVPDPRSLSERDAPRLPRRRPHRAPKPLPQRYSISFKGRAAIFANCYRATRFPNRSRRSTVARARPAPSRRDAQGQHTENLDSRQLPARRPMSEPAARATPAIR